MRKTIMILGASVLQLPAIIKAKQMGLNVVVADMNPNAVGFQEAGIIKEVVSTIDREAVLEAARRNHIHGIMTLASDMPMRTVAYVCKNMGLSGIDEETAYKATDKVYMRKALRAGNVPIPAFYRIKTKAEYLDTIDQISADCIVKPADNSGSRGVSLIHKGADVQTIESAYQYAKSCSRSGGILVEEYMKGPEVSVETLSINGVCSIIQITDKLTTGAPHFVEMGHSQPSRLEESVQQEIKRVATLANQAIGIRQGPSHTEIIVTEQGPKIVEIGARLGGDCITTHLVPLSTGVDMVEITIRIALGESPVIPKINGCGSAIRYFRQSSGIVRAIEGISQAEKMKGIREIQIVHGIGEKIGEVNDSASRMGFVIAQDATAEDAVKDCENALKAVQIIVEKDEK